MADIQSNIKVSIDTTDALASIKNLQRQISAFHTSMAKGGAAANAVTAQMQQGLINSINATGKFSAQMKTIRTTTESFTNSLEKNKFSLGEYFRYAGGASKSFGRLFKSEFETINKVARENVKDLQTQYIKMGRDANGAMKAIAVRPLSLDMSDLATKTMIASEKQAILNQLLKQGSTNLLNFGKNTQWAGRQLMVGFTVPLISVGTAAAKTFMDMETQAIRFKKVYGDLFTPASETQAALDGITELGKQFTKYGVAVSSTVSLAAEAAAAGFQGLDLQRQTAAATKLSILGQVESQKALETTIALQNAFSMSSEDLATNIDFLNAVENQTVLSLDDMSTAIPKAAPVIQQLGGDVKDLAFFMTAMKEGGINASEGANALKSGLASMINPTAKASAMLAGFGINIKKIVVDNKGDLKKTVIDFATALNQLDPLNRAQAIEQMFGKFQFARLSTLFANVTKEGTQASRVLDLAGSSVQDLAALSEKELGMTSESAMNKFKASIENLKLSLVPVGEEFLKAVTPIAEFVTKILDKFNNLGDGTKKAIVIVTTAVAGLGPVLLMTFGLLANGVANIIKGFVALKSLFNKTGQSSATLGTEVKYMTTEQRNAAAVAASLDQVHRNLAQTFTSEAAAVDALVRAYNRAIAAQASFMPTSMPMGRGPIRKRAAGKPSVVGGTGNQDTELALLTPGETVIPKDMSKKYGSLINGMIAGNIPGYNDGLGTDANATWIASMGTTVSSDANNKKRLALQKYLADEIAKIINKVGPELVIDFKDFMETTASEMQKVSKTALDKALKEQRVILEQYSPQSYAMAEGQQFAHVGSGIGTTAANLQASGAITHQKTADRLAELVRVLPDKPLGIKTGFGFDIMGRLNNLMGSTGANLEEVINEFNTNGIDKWKKMVKIGGGSFEDLSAQLQRYDGEVSNLLQQRLNAGATTIVDTTAELEQARAKALAAGERFDSTVYVVMEEIDTQARANLNMLGTELNNVIETALRTITEVRLNLTAQEDALLGGNFMGTSNGKARLSGRIDATASATYRRFGGVGEINDNLRASAIQTTDDLIDTVRDTAGVRSPSTRTIPVGQDIARGLEVGMKAETGNVVAAAENMTDAAVNGSRRRRAASRPQGAPVTPVVPGKRVRRGASRAGGTVGAGGIIIPSRPNNQPIDPNAPMLGPNRPTRFDKTAGRVAGRFRSSTSKIGSKLSGTGAGMGISTAAMLASSMMPGKIGDLVQKISMLGFAFSALKPVIMSLVAIIGAGPMALVAVAGLLAFGIFKLNKSAEEAAKAIQESAKKEAEARYGSSRAIEQFGEKFNKSLPSAREFSRNNQQSIAASGTKVNEFAKDYASKGNISTQIINQAALKGKASGAAAAAMDVAQRAAIFGLSPDEIAANIKAASDLIGADQVKVKLAVQKLLSPDGKDILKEPLTIQARMNFLNENTKKQIKTINESIVNISKIGEISKPKSIAQTIIGNTSAGAAVGGVAGSAVPGIGTGAGALAGIGAGLIKSVPSILNASEANKAYRDSQDKIQSATVQLSIAFMQQKESLALLNSQYADGLITEAEYNAQMQISSSNFESLKKSSISLVNQLRKIDKSGELAAAAVEDLGNQTLGTLKKSNPALFDKITNSFKNLSNSAKINIYMGYAQGSMTIMDLALIPEILKKISGKTFEVALKIIADSELSAGGQAGLTIPVADAEVALAKAKADQAKAQKTLDVSAQVAADQRLAKAKSVLAAAKKAQADAAKVNKTGNLDTDTSTYKDVTDGAGKAKTATERYLEVLQKEIDALKAKRDAQKDANDEVQRQIDLEMKLKDLSNQATQAKISGNYIQAAILGQQAQNEQMKFNKETELKKQDAEIAALEARYKALKDGAPRTKAEIAKTPKKANGGLIKGPGTGRSDSIRATLGYAGGGSIRVSNGEFVVKASSVRDYGLNAMNAVNNGTAQISTNSGGTVYNINMPITSNNASPEGVANEVMRRLKVEINKNNKTNKVGL